MRFARTLCAPLALSAALAHVAVADPAADEVATRLQTLTSKSSGAKSDVPKFAFTSNMTWDGPASLAEAEFGFPALTQLDKAKTVVGFADPDTAFISGYLGEFSQCPANNCAKASPESWLRATAVLERTSGVWQPVAWSITPPIPGDAQVQAMGDGIVPDKLAAGATGAEAVATLFSTTCTVPKAFAATVSSRKETVLMGSELPERYTGAQVAKQLQSWNLSFVVRDGVRAGMSKSGKLAWVAANVNATQAKRPNAKPIPYRVFAIYELVGTDWKLVQLQFSTAV